MSLAQLLQTTIAVGSASSLMFRSFAGSISMSDIFFHLLSVTDYICTYEMIWVKPAYEKCSHSDVMLMFSMDVIQKQN